MKLKKSILHKVGFFKKDYYFETNLSAYEGYMYLSEFNDRYHLKMYLLNSEEIGLKVLNSVKGESYKKYNI